MLLWGRACAATPLPDHAALVADGVAEPPDAWIQMRSDGVVPVAWIQAWLRRPSQDSDFLSNATQMRVTPGQVEAESNGMDLQLSVMADRANKARRCAKTIPEKPSSSEIAPIQADGFHAADDTEIAVCVPAKLAFIHTYKSGGTTIAGSLHQLCRETYDWPPLGESGGFVCKNNPACTQSLSDAWSLMTNYTWFTFVREPVSRFESGIFELARRDNRCVMDAAKDDSVGDELALNVLRECLLGLREDQRPDPHIKPQLSYLLEPNRTVTPLLSYVGHIENVTNEWPAIVASFFGAEHGAQVRASLLQDVLHARDGSGGEYTEDVPSKFRLQIAQDATRASVVQAYRADRMCLGYEGIGPSPSPSPSPSASRRYEDAQ